MLRNSKRLNAFVVHATDGELGTVDQLYLHRAWLLRLSPPKESELASWPAACP
jgi:hypothetical protein